MEAVLSKRFLMLDMGLAIGILEEQRLTYNTTRTIASLCIGSTAPGWRSDPAHEKGHTPGEETGAGQGRANKGWRANGRSRIEEPGRGAEGVNGSCALWA